MDIKFDMKAKELKVINDIKETINMSNRDTFINNMILCYDNISNASTTNGNASYYVDKIDENSTFAKCMTIFNNGKAVEYRIAPLYQKESIKTFDALNKWIITHIYNGWTPMTNCRKVTQQYKWGSITIDFDHDSKKFPYSFNKVNLIIIKI